MQPNNMSLVVHWKVATPCMVSILCTVAFGQAGMLPGFLVNEQQKV